MQTWCLQVFRSNQTENEQVLIYRDMYVHMYITKSIYLAQSMKNIVAHLSLHVASAASIPLLLRVCHSV